MAIGAYARSLLTHEARALAGASRADQAVRAAGADAADRGAAAGCLGRDRPLPGHGPARAAPPDPRLPRLAEGAGQRQRASDEEAQRRFAILRLKFNVALVQFDTFADVVTQRSENETGVWLSGLDVVAADALALPGYYDAPPVICYLDRDIGAAIRRARTRMPGGGENPVAIIRIPRERMIGTGIASSLVHEVGHQAAALLDLVDSLRPALRQMQRDGTPAQLVWKLWERWISEIVADFWSVARVGIAATLGLIGGGQPAARVRVPHEHRTIRTRCPGSA